MRKNYAKFRLIVVWFGRTRDVKDFSDVTLAWEDEERGDVWDLQVKVKVNNFNDMALAWEDEVWEKSSRTSRKVNVNWSTWAWEDGLKWKLFDERNYFEILSFFGFTDEELHCLVEIRNEQQSEIWRTKNALQTYSDQIKNWMQ